MIWIWLALIVLVVLLDMATSNILYSWMALGFLAAVILAVMEVSVPTQVITACIVGSITFMIGSLISRKYLKRSIDATPILTDKILGTIHTADTEIREETQYKINGIYWLLRNEGTPIMPGEQFRIVGIKNNRLYVAKEN
ncbi:hypothetical protein ABB02_01601 [Clostridiaceae bacterium JG1575]|nr:hypothetical protein ABB02_01601 [Clostridiaceae bacterium JG1575]